MITDSEILTPLLFSLKIADKGPRQLENGSSRGAYVSQGQAPALILPPSVAVLGVSEANSRCGDEDVSMYIQVPDTNHSNHPWLLNSSMLRPQTSGNTKNLCKPQPF